MSYRSRLAIYANEGLVAAMSLESGIRAPDNPTFDHGDLSTRAEGEKERLRRMRE
jgi:hypothetical protein